MPEGGAITINISASRKEVNLVLSNPCPAQGSHHAGNKMALGNIRERLALHFDAEASLTSKTSADSYEVHIMIPYHREQ
jgi:two-component system sensor histidine kinase AlgZ